jgi:hypothetical protein
MIVKREFITKPIHFLEFGNNSQDVVLESVATRS